MDKNQGYEIQKAVMLENGRALRWGITPLRPRPMSHGLAMTTIRGSDSMNGDITEMTELLWNRTLPTEYRTISGFTK